MVTMWKPFTRDEETQRLADTLAVLLEEITAFDKGKRVNRRSDIQQPEFAAISANDISKMPDLYWDAEKIGEAPVREACATTLTMLGKRLHEMGGVDLMQDVHDRVVKRTRRHGNYWSMLLDKRWDGIGGEWWA